MMSAASLGLSLLWDTEVGLSHIDKYTYSAEEHIKVGGSDAEYPEFLIL
jgi:26S proteasome regulatory subunit N1